MRPEIAILLGVRATRAYGLVYEREFGRPVRDLKLCDLVCGLDALRLSPPWVLPYFEQGAELRQQQARGRAMAFLEDAVAPF